MHSIKTGLNRDKPEEGLLLLVVQNEWRIFLPHKIIIWERFGQTRNQLLMNHFFRRKQRICLSSQRCDFFTSNPTGHNVLKVLQVSIYVAGQTMTSDSRGDMNPNRTNLSIPDPNHLDEGHGKWYVLLFEYEYSEAQLQCLWVQLQGSVGCDRFYVFRGCKMVMLKREECIRDSISFSLGNELVLKFKWFQVVDTWQCLAS